MSALGQKQPLRSLAGERLLSGAYRTFGQRQNSLISGEMRLPRKLPDSHPTGMEKMRITILSVVEDDHHYRARARAVAEDARISLEVRFQADEGASKAELWGCARDEVPAVFGRCLIACQY